MTKALPRKWFPNLYQATIRLRKVDKWADFHRKHNPYFDTWEEAHAYQREHAAQQLEHAERMLRSAKRYAAKVSALQPNT